MTGPYQKKPSRGSGCSWVAEGRQRSFKRAKVFRNDEPVMLCVSYTGE